MQTAAGWTAEAEPIAVLKASLWTRPLPSTGASPWRQVTGPLATRLSAETKIELMMHLNTPLQRWKAAGQPSTTRKSRTCLHAPGVSVLGGNRCFWVRG